MQIAVTDYKASFAGTKVTIDTDKIISIFDCNGVFDGRSMKGWNIVLQDGEKHTSVLVDNDDIGRCRSVPLTHY